MKDTHFNVLELGVFGIKITYNPDIPSRAVITSKACESNCLLEDAAFHGLKSMILAHFRAGLDVTSNDYLEGIETAWQEISDRYHDISEIGSLKIRDWRFGESSAENDLNLDYLPAEDRCTYALKITQSITSGAVYFSVYNAEFDALNKGGEVVYPTGLHGIIEIRDGLPALSVGVAPDDNDIHVISNTSNKLAIIKENDNAPHDWRPVEFIQASHVGMVLEVDDKESLEESRSIMAEARFANFDFGDNIVESSSGWAVDGSVWKKTLFLEREQGGDTESCVLVVRFKEDSAYIFEAVIEAP